MYNVHMYIHIHIYIDTYIRIYIYTHIYPLKVGFTLHSSSQKDTTVFP